MFSASMTDAGTTSMQSSISEEIVDMTASSKTELHAPADHEEQRKQKSGHAITYMYVSHTCTCTPY